jgi:uncharacterized membrane protein YhaH (DUF805 family)
LTETPARSRFAAFINLLFGYDGRIGRLYCFLGFLAFCAIIGFFSGIAEDATAGTGDIGRYVALVFIVGSGIWMHSAVTIKRLHDRDKSAAWYLVCSSPRSISTACGRSRSPRSCSSCRSPA